MIYELGEKLQVTDFTSESESKVVTTQLRHDLSNAASNCIFCLLHSHSGHEEEDIFSALQARDPDIVTPMLTAHQKLNKRIFDVAKTCDELAGSSDPARRIEVGDRLCLEANDLFAFYLAHLNNEEATVVPVLWENFTDEQLRAMRAAFYASVPLSRFEEWMRWTLPALNMNELLVLFSGMKTDPPPSRYQDALRLAKMTLDPARFGILNKRLGPGAA